MEEHVESFKKKEVTIIDVLKMNEEDIQETFDVCGIRSYGKRFKLIEKI